MLILASASPRRRDLLTAAGVAFDVRPADVDESWLSGELPRAYVLRVARLKAQAVGESRVLAADTTVALGQRVLGKPADLAHSRAMLADLSGVEHQVHTAVVLRAGTKLRHRLVTTRVRFRVLTPADIEAYLATGEGRDKAGSYGIQGIGGALVDAVFGSYTNVVGLPLAETLALLAVGGS